MYNFCCFISSSYCKHNMFNLISLKVEDAIRVAMAQHRRRNMQKPAFTGLHDVVVLLLFMH